MKSNALAIQPTSVPYSKKKGADADDYNRGELCGINIEMTDNGCEVECRFDPEEINPNLDRYSQMPEPSKKSFGTSDDKREEAINAATEYIRKMMLGAAAEEAAEDKGKKGEED